VTPLSILVLAALVALIAFFLVMWVRLVLD